MTCKIGHVQFNHDCPECTGDVAQPPSAVTLAVPLPTDRAFGVCRRNLDAERKLRTRDQQRIAELERDSLLLSQEREHLLQLRAIDHETIRRLQEEIKDVSLAHQRRILAEDNVRSLRSIDHATIARLTRETSELSKLSCTLSQERDAAERDLRETKAAHARSLEMAN